MAVITISREMGSGGNTLGKLLARRLGYAVADQELVARVARKEKVSQETVAQYDQEEFRRESAFWERLFAGNPAAFSSLYMGTTFPSEVGAAATLVPEFNQDKYLSATRSLIRALARKGRVVIMGRGGQVILAGQKSALHLRIVAPLEARVKRVRRWLKLPEQEARKAIQRRDKAYAQYLKYFYGRDWNDPLLYDLVLNTGSVSLPEAADLVTALVKGK